MLGHVLSILGHVLTMLGHGVTMFGHVRTLSQMLGSRVLLRVLGIPSRQNITNASHNGP